MTRKPTPNTILDDVLTSDIVPDRSALRQRLRWDYSQVAPIDRRQVQDAAVDILANGQRMQESAVAIGERLIAVKRLLEHGAFSDWCSTEFSMSMRTAQNLMNVAREFAGKSETVSLLTDSAMYILAAPSTPSAARNQAIEEAQDTGKSPTKKRIVEIVAQHKPGPVVQPIPTPTTTEYGAAVQATQPSPTTAQPLPSNGYAMQSQIEDWLTEIPATAAQILDAVETLAGPIWDQLFHLAAGEGYELSPITSKAALRNAASQAAHEERKSAASQPAQPAKLTGFALRQQLVGRTITDAYNLPGSVSLELDNGQTITINGAGLRFTSASAAQPATVAPRPSPLAPPWTDADEDSYQCLMAEWDGRTMATLAKLAYTCATDPAAACSITPAVARRLAADCPTADDKASLLMTAERLERDGQP